MLDIEFLCEYIPMRLKSFLLIGTLEITYSSLVSFLGLGRELEAFMKSTMAGATFAQFLPREFDSYFDLADCFLLFAEFC